MVMISRDRSMSCFELRIRCLQSALMWCVSMVVKRRAGLTKKSTSSEAKRPQRSSPQGRNLSRRHGIVDEAKPEKLVGVWLSERLCRSVNGYSRVRWEGAGKREAKRQGRGDNVK
jgi:hypothetical protein